MTTLQQLTDAVEAGDAQGVRRLLDSDAQLGKGYSKEGWSMLHLAATGEVAGLLLDAGADIEAPNRHPVLGPGNKPLHSAVYMDRHDVVDLLIERGADANSTDRAGWTPLQIAVSNGRLDLARKLLKSGADPNTRISVVEGQAWSNKTALELLGVENRTGEGPSAVPQEVDDEMRRVLLEHGARE